MFKDTKSLGNNKASAWESRGFVIKKEGMHFDTPSQLRASVKDFAEKHELDKFFLYGFGSHHFYLHQRYTSDPEMVMQHRVLSVHF